MAILMIIFFATRGFSFLRTIDMFCFLVIVERSIRYSVIAVSFNIILSDYLTNNMKEHYRTMRQPYRKKRTLLRRMNVYHTLYVRTIERCDMVNKVAVRQFYTIAMVMNFLANLSMTAALLTERMPMSSFLLFVSICLSQTVLFYLSVHYLYRITIYMVSPCKIMLHSLNHLTRNKQLHHKAIITFSAYFEIYLHKKPFRFQLGPMGTINRKNILFFLMFYSSNFMFTYESMKNVPSYRMDALKFV